ncbi:LacI family DNA-binding transcriptional regulator [Propionibacteriaceae bacterium Y2011]
MVKPAYVCKNGGVVRITSAVVARAAGVSQSTVSRAFSADHLVSEETRRRVLAEAERLGYRSNPSGRILSTGRMGAVGIVVPDLSNPYFARIAQHLQRALRSSDHHLLVADAGEETADELQIARDLAMHADAVVMCASRAAKSELVELAEELGDKPLVLTGRRASGLHHISVDESQGAMQALDHLAGLGHRRIAFMGGPSRSPSHRARVTALRRGASVRDLEMIMLGSYEPTAPAGMAAAREACRHGVTALIAFNDRTGLGAMAYFGEQGVKIPQDISVLSWDDLDLAIVATPQLTTIGMPVAELGERSAAVVLDLLAGREPDPVPPLPTTLIIRRSTGPAPMLVTTP